MIAGIVIGLLIAVGILDILLVFGVTKLEKDHSPCNTCIYCGQEWDEIPCDTCDYLHPNWQAKE